VCELAAIRVKREQNLPRNGGRRLSKSQSLSGTFAAVVEGRA
jgi:hypothetical protein